MLNRNVLLRHSLDYLCLSMCIIKTASLIFDKNSQGSVSFFFFPLCKMGMLTFPCWLPWVAGSFNASKALWTREPLWQNYWELCFWNLIAPLKKKKKKLRTSWQEYSIEVHTYYVGNNIHIESGYSVSHFKFWTTFHYPWIHFTLIIFL